MRGFIIAIFTLCCMSQAMALNIVASSTSTGFLVREIAGEYARLTILAPPDRNLHHLQARPSMILALRRADMVVSLGAELEIGWLPLAISQSANNKILPGSKGYFEAAAQVKLLDTGLAADRSMGDVHPTGNPHINMDPVRMGKVGLTLAEQLSLLDSEHAEYYRARAIDFVKKIDLKVDGWSKQLTNPPGVVSYHKDMVYLLNRFKVPALGTLEPVAGVPPSASHIQSLVEKLKGQKGVVLYTVYQPEQVPVSISDTLGWKAVRLPLEPPLDADGNAYLEHIQRWIDALTG